MTKELSELIQHLFNTATNNRSNASLPFKLITDPKQTTINDLEFPVIKKEVLMPKVYIVSKSAHDFSDAERYGTLVSLSSGPMNRYNVNNIHRQFEDIMRESREEDYVLICGLSIMSSIACGIMAAKHNKLNILLFKKGKYVERNLILKEEQDDS